MYIKIGFITDNENNVNNYFIKELFKSRVFYSIINAWARRTDMYLI